MGGEDSNLEGAVQFQRLKLSRGLSPRYTFVFTAYRANERAKEYRKSAAPTGHKIAISCRIEVMQRACLLADLVKKASQVVGCLTYTTVLGLR